ncbi:MAG: DinB family protein, partial [Actinomycetota bacterium]
EERAMLIAWLDYQRHSILHKVEGLTDEQARWTPAAGANSLLGIVYHLGRVEHGWFQACFEGEERIPAPSWAVEGDDDWDLHPDGSIGLDDAIKFYKSQWARGNEIARAAGSLDDVGAFRTCEERGITLRWILIHMIEETARHAGHADITRELIDGSTGMI